MSGTLNSRPDDADLNIRFYEIRKYFHTEVKARSGLEKRFILILVQFLEIFFRNFLKKKQSNKKESRVEQKAKINMFSDYSLSKSPIVFVLLTRNIVFH